MKTPAKIIQTRTNVQTRNEGRLSEREKLIDKYLAVAEGAWFEIGKELAAIQAEGEFPEKTFEAYIKRRFGHERAWGYKLIDAYRVKAELPENVSHGIQNERQALALKAAPEELRAEVLAEASKDGAPTAKKISEAVEQKKAAKKEETKEADFEELDELGAVIPKALREEWGRAEEIGKDYLAKVSVIRSGLKEEDSIFGEMDGVLEIANDLYASLKQIIPYCVCPICKGKKCKVCHKRGFISKLLYKNSGKSE